MLLILTLGIKAQTKNIPCSEKTAKILIVGLYHMDNPGQDRYNIESDDVLSPKRQKEITEVINKIARFQPTKIAIESAYRSTYWTSRYEKFLKGEYKLERNEVEQIGFQLAKKLKHPTLFPVDYPMWMNGTLASEREEPKKKPNPSPTPQPVVNEPPPKLPDFLVKQENLIKTGTVIDVLRYLNTEEYIRQNNNTYAEMLLPTENLYIYDETDQVTNWYKRNLRIFTNINRITDFPNDRILLIIGAGHLKILRELAKDSSYFCLMDTAEFLK